jgi:glycosyltransferase involved in cell wall biosynthesis
MSSAKFLTISIPTWNRSLLLKKLLEELTEEISSNGLEDEIELLVSNNNSSDETEEVVNEFRSKKSFVTYNRNDSNIGAKSNVLKSMYLAGGKFVLFIGDDDRISKGALSKLLMILKREKDACVIIDSANAKTSHAPGSISVDDLLKDYFWYIGNAGCFIIRSEYIRQYLDKFGFDFFNECWPQTQITILSLSDHKNEKCYIDSIGIHAESSHADVMLYNSFYLWRTCTIELLTSVNDIKKYIASSTYNSARIYLKKNIFQQFFNILQCAVFVDDPDTRKKTRRHILKNLNKFSFYERVIFFLLIIVIFIPRPLSRFLSNVFIYTTRGRSGLEKKNSFVKHELKKREKNAALKSGALRTLDFEIDNYSNNT